MTTHTHNFENSSMLDSCSYNEDEKELTVTFKNGKDYIYEGVSKEEYEGFVSAKSAGQYFGSQIKGRYKVKS